ncbi:MAG: ribosomal protein S18-alanine N-acetyltransferase [Bacillota bacterium]
MLSPKIRNMTTDDLDQVMEIEKSSFPLPWSRGSFEKELRDNNYACYLVAHTGENGKITGYAGCWVLFDEAHITTLAVHPLYRRTGTGSVLLTSLMELAYERGARQVFLEVRDSNEAARNLYEKFGFKIRGIRKKYYLDEDALVMARNFGTTGL